MILAIDIGNTTVALCGLEDGCVRFEAHLDTDPGMTGPAYEAALHRAFCVEGMEHPRFKGAVITSVVPSLTPVLARCAAKYCDRAPLLAGHGLKTGLTMGVPYPQGVGVDRIVDSAAAAAYYPLPVVTVDLGTATTFNVIDENRVFRGGAIAPGLCTGLNALHEKTAQLPQVEPSVPTSVIGTDTESCILSGTVAGASAMIDGLVLSVEEELGKPVTLVITGGLSKFVTDRCRHPHVRDEHLLVKGLALLYELNS